MTDIVSRLAYTLAQTRASTVPIVLTQEDARELLRLALLADPWHICTADGPAPLPKPRHKRLDLPADPPDLRQP